MRPTRRLGGGTGVSCTSSTVCVVVGGGSYIGCCILFAGLPPPSLHAVSCVSRTACIAVGDSEDFPDDGTEATLTQRWNGRRWSVLPAPSPGGLDHLIGVSCTSATACTAVGYSRGLSSDNSWALVERWDGSKWSTQRDAAPGSDRVLTSVSCTSKTSCTAVGALVDDANHRWATLVEHWNGRKWSIQHAAEPDPPANSVLIGVSCASSRNCTAVGASEPGGFCIGGSPCSQVPLAERWNGTSWSVQSTPTPAGATGTVLNGVSCNTRSACTAVGSSSGEPLVERWNR